MSDDKTQRLVGGAELPRNAEQLPTSDKRFTTIEVDPNTNSADPIAQILSELKKSSDEKIKKSLRLSYDVDPQLGYSNYEGLYKQKTSLIPNIMLKRIRDTEELIGGVILPVRARQIASFARPRANRFDVGFTVNIKPQILEGLSDEKIKELKETEVPKIKELMLNCGSNEGLKDKEKRTLSQYFSEIIEDALTFGWFATEIIKTESSEEFQYFRAVDAGTIYFAAPKADAAQSIREQAIVELQRIRDGIDGQGKIEVDPERFIEDDYTWVQVIQERPRQFFTDDELLVWTLSPSTDILRSGYPVTIFDRIINAITTHINITTHNKMYFINGRASRNILVFKSENLDKEDVEMIRAQMNAHINSSNAAWRMPVFGIGTKDEVDTVALDAAGRDMEFQYLSDLTKRMIFAAFQMSPDEVAALSYLSRGTNSQSMAEANNEWKLIAARDIGLRPLLLSVEDFINERLLPKINPEWAKLFYIDLEGLDADTPEKEATRLEQDSAIYMNMNDIMDRVEKQKVPLAGEFPMNAAWLAILEKYYTKGQILESFGGEQYKGYGDKTQHPEFDYYLGDEMYLEVKQMLNPPPQPGQPGQPGGGAPQQPQDLDSVVAQLQELLNKSEGLTKAEKSLPKNRRELLKLHKQIKDKVTESWQAQSQDMLNQIMNALGDKDDGHGHE
jgi:hypothetical protein